MIYFGPEAGANDRAFQITNEPDPFMREILAQGYDEVEYMPQGDNVVSLRCYGLRYEKKFDRYEWRSLLNSVSIRRGILPDGRVHAWIKESNGDAQRFRDAIKIPAHA